MYRSAIKGMCWMLWDDLVHEVDGGGGYAVWEIRAAFLGKGCYNKSLQKHKLRAQEGGAAKHSASFTLQVQRLGTTVEMLAQCLLQTKHCCKCFLYM